MRKSLFYGVSKICFPRMVKRDRFGRFVVDPSDYGMTPSYMKRVENQYEKSMQTGRSMLEVMFVVGLMTVISLGGIKGYEIITNKAKARSVANLVSTLVKERQARSLSLSEGKSDIQKVKIGDKEILVQNGTPQDGNKEPFFWVDVDFDKKAECKEFLYTDFIQPAFMAVDNSIPGECPGKVRLYFPKDPQDNTSGIKTYVNPSDGKIYICEGDDCSSAGGNSYSLACRTGYTPNKDKTKCEKITCSTYRGTGFANEYYAGGFVGFANDGVTRCYCPTGQTFEVDQCITSTSECSGHGSNSSGLCSCLAGYCGNNCENRVTCFNAGIWTEHGCNCAEGWAGTYCDEPASNNCSNHGVYQGNRCICNEGYYGAACEYYNDCSGNGRVNTDGTCTCDDGYYGTDCENRENTDSCNGHGIDCGSGCVCNEGYYGTYCESYNDCSGNGQVDSNGTCTCNSDYYGADCEYYNDCSGNGRVNPDGTCTCNDGYYGTDCEDEYCSGHGTLCGGYCSCDDGWYGTYCESEGASDLCNGHGTLNWPGAHYWQEYEQCGGSCLCDKGYASVRGQRCDDFNDNHCNGHGQSFYGYTPSAYGRSATCGCLCDKGWYRVSCSYKDPNISVCSDKGRSLVFGNFVGCLCDDGTLQEGDPINGNLCATGAYDVCSGHGTLNWPGAHYFRRDVTNYRDFPNLCLCDKGYFAPDDGGGNLAQCNAFFDNCHGHGQWTVCGCLCESGYYGTFCDKTSDTICSNYGRSIEFGNYSYCLCDNGAIERGNPITGNVCASAAHENCFGHGTWQEDGAYCACDAGYCGAYCESEAASDPCNGHGTLNWAGANHWPLYPNLCLCEKGYTGQIGISSQCSLVCGGNRCCSNHGQWYGCGCVCDIGYCGQYCENTTSSACNGQGRVGSFLLYSQSFCLCNDGTIQEGYNACASTSTECSGHGTLNWLGANYWSGYSDVCLCDKGYYGADCSQSKSACYNHGQYSVVGCVCDSGYQGSECYSSGDLCNGNGQYIAFGFDYNNGSCLCNDGTIQTGDSACASSTECSGHGTLNWPGANHWPQYPNMCLCDKGYWRSEPSMAQCSKFTYISDNHRKPLGLINGGAYVCDSGYYGSHCEEYKGSSAVCNGHGQYIAYGSSSLGCLCDDNTIQTGDGACAFECSGHGEWCGSGCSCFDGWMGDDCNTETSSACNNHGTLNWPGANYLSGYYSNACLCAKNYADQHCGTTGGTACDHGFWTDFCGCLCDSGYCGNSCQNVNASVCHGNGQYINSTAFTGCLCDDNTFQTGANACAGRCNGHGTLNWPGRNYFVYTDLCLCDEGYRQGNGSMVDGQCASTCSVDWTCCHHHGRRVVCGCLCDAGYCGSYCETRNSAACDGRGQFYYAEDVTGKGCFCDDGTFETGDDACKIHDCSGHGTWCGGFCSCDDGWYGKNCNYDDSREPCSDHGSWGLCGSLCDCDEGWAGELCNKSSACSGHGILNWPGRNYFSGHSDVCLCDQGYGAINCSIYVSQYQTKGNYIGVSTNSMDGAYVCFAGYCGSYCDKAGNPCNGKGRAMVGYSKGSLTSFGCLCDDNTIQTGDGACACGTHGTKKNGVCVCDTGWSGTYCENELNPCSGHGTKTNGTCVCNSGYTGTNCETECSGNGTRNKDGSCACNNGYCGTNCENVRSDSDCGFKIGNDCYSCSYLGEAGGFNWESSKTECDKCSNREIYTDFYGNKTCALSATSCYASYQEGGFRGGCGAACLSCSVTESVETFAADCRKCSNREMITSGYYKYCVLTSAACHSRYPEGGFRNNDGRCFSCSYENGIYNTSTTECKKCSNREMLDDSCVLASAACHTRYPEGGFRDDWGACYSCSYSSGVSTSKDECAKCDGTSNPRFMGYDGYCYSCSFNERVDATADDCAKCNNTNYPREMYKNRCVPSTATCNALYPEGGFRDNYGYCYSCSYSNGKSASPDECAKCDGTSNPRFMGDDDTCWSCFDNKNAISATATECKKCSNREMVNGNCAPSTAACNALYPEGWFRSDYGRICVSCSLDDGVSATADDCAECDETNNPRFKSNDGWCYSCSYSDAKSASAVECAKCGDLRYYSNRRCYKK